MDNVDSTDTGEGLKVNAWSYKDLQLRTTSYVRELKEMPLDDLPDIIELGNIGHALNSLAKSSDASDHHEWSIVVGVQKKIPHKFIFSKAMQGDQNGFSTANFTPSDTFSKPTLEQMDGISALLHSHPVPVVFSPVDILPVRYVSGLSPVVGLGTGNFKMLAIRSDKTDYMATVAESEGKPDLFQHRIQQETHRLIRKYPGEFDEIFSILPPDNSKSVMSLNENEITRLNTLYDKLLRNEAKDHGIGLYVGSFEDNKVTKCNLDIPIKEQLR